MFPVDFLPDQCQLMVNLCFHRMLDMTGTVVKGFPELLELFLDTFTALFVQLVTRFYLRTGVLLSFVDLLCFLHLFFGSQLMSFLLIPDVFLYKIINTDTEGL